MLNFTIDTISDKTLNAEGLAQIITWAAQDEDALQKFLAKNPDWGVWGQGTWGAVVRNGECQTAYCIAGQSAVQAGYAFNIEDFVTASREDLEEDYYTTDVAELTDGGNEARARFVIPDEALHEKHYFKDAHTTVYPAKRISTPGGKGVLVADTSKQARDVREVAVEYLGIEGYEATTLFDGDNDLYMVVNIAHAIALNHGVELPNLPKHVTDMVDRQEMGYYLVDAWGRGRWEHTA